EGDRPRGVEADDVPLDDGVRPGGDAEADAGEAGRHPGDDVAGPGARDGREPADRRVLCARADQDCVVEVADGGGAGRIRPDVVAEDRVVVGGVEEVDAAGQVAADDVAGRGRGPA